MLKKIIQNIIYPKGSVAKIVRGPLKGYKFIVSENSGWSPIVGRWETESQELFVHIIKKGWTVYDLGANNGIHSLLFGHLVGENGRVIAFEPFPDNVKEIEKNASLNNLTNITIVEKAVSNSEGVAMFKVGAHNKQGSLIGIGKETGSEIEINITTLNDCVKGGLPAPDFMKIDIEGAEGDALEGADIVFEQSKPSVIIELHSIEQEQRVATFLQKHQYLAYRVITTRSYKNDLSLPYLEKIEFMNKFSPTPGGFWGTVLAFHPEKLAYFQNLTK
jgi:FkbM family methyltransferase